MRFLNKILSSIIKRHFQFQSISDYNARNKIKNELSRLKTTPRYQEGTSDILEKTIKFIDSASFCFIYDELFIKEIYKFKTTSTRPYIIDAGANVGLSVIYFKNLFPASEIIAFEPDPVVFNILSQNVRSFELQNVELIPKALWNKEISLNFLSEGADAGRIVDKVNETNLIEVQTVRLGEYLNCKVDFLKIDIEGAETTVLEDCKDMLYNVERIFVEYHSFIDKPQELGRLINILESSGFRLSINSSGAISPQPLYQYSKYLGMDMQLNIFGFKANSTAI